MVVYNILPLEPVNFYHSFVKTTVSLQKIFEISHNQHWQENCLLTNLNSLLVLTGEWRPNNNLRGVQFRTLIVLTRTTTDTLSKESGALTLYIIIMIMEKTHPMVRHEINMLLHGQLQRCISSMQRNRWDWETHRPTDRSSRLFDWSAILFEYLCTSIHSECARVFNCCAVQWGDI